jgi:hypothetical protein
VDDQHASLSAAVTFNAPGPVEVSNTAACCIAHSGKTLEFAEQVQCVSATDAEDGGETGIDEALNDGVRERTALCSGRRGSSRIVHRERSLHHCSGANLLQSANHCVLPIVRYG